MTAPYALSPERLYKAPGGTQTSVATSTPPTPGTGSGVGTAPLQLLQGTSNVAFIVEGIPIPKGSMKGYRRGKHVIVTNDNPKTRPWEAAVSWHASQARHQLGGRVEGPVRVALWFAFDKPKSTPKKITAKITKPDIDKLARAVLDGLTEGGLLKDDALVVELRASKCFTGQDPRLPTPGCVVSVEKLS